jgi:hypothetical protein
MRHVIVMIVAVFMFASAVCFADSGMTCGTNIVSVGDLKPTILAKCGTPFMKGDLGGGGTRERWIYNFGSSEFMKILTFDGDQLEKIEDGEKGTDK